MLSLLKPFGVGLEVRSQSDLEQLSGEALLSLLKEHSLLLIRGLRNLTPLELRSFALSFPNSQLLQWETGDVMEMKPSIDPKNYLFSREKVPFHWDGAFFKVPDFLVFQCIEAPELNAGGETLFSNTEKIFSQLSVEERQRLSAVTLTYKTEKLAHYGGEFSTPVLHTHPITGKGILRFAEEVTTSMNPVSLSVAGSPNPEDLVKDLTSKIYSEEVCYSHRWQKGDLLIADNHALLHGRRPFLEESERHLRRVQVRINEIAS